MYSPASGITSAADVSSQTIFASNKDTSYEDSMTADVSVQYNGLCTSGDIDVDVKSSDQYKSYSQEVSQSVSCRGGEDSLAISLNSGFRADDVYATFTNWAQTTAGPKPNPAVMSLQTVTLWDAMTATFDPNIIKHAPDVKLAYKWIMENPELYQTKCRFTINSDWGEFGITSPNAFVIQDPDHPPPTDNLPLTGTKVTWGNQHPHDFQPVTIEYVPLMYHL
jgi:hypothetical protein